VNDLAQLTAHENSHTIARHGADITDAQLLVRAQTGITPDGIIASVPSMSTRFSSNQKLVQAKNDVQNQFDNGNFTLDGNDRIVKINSADVYGQGIAGGAPDGTLPTDVTGVTARYRENSDGVWQLVTMFPGTTT